MYGCVFVLFICVSFDEAKRFSRRTQAETAIITFACRMYLLRRTFLCVKNCRSSQQFKTQKRKRWLTTAATNEIENGNWFYVCVCVCCWIHMTFFLLLFSSCVDYYPGWWMCLLFMYDFSISLYTFQTHGFFFFGWESQLEIEWRKKIQSYINSDATVP